MVCISRSDKETEIDFALICRCPSTNGLWVFFVYVLPYIWVIRPFSLTGGNVHIVHRCQTVTSPALIGLLNLINASEALRVTAVNA